jgi:hypothetical protein
VDRNRGDRFVELPGQRRLLPHAGHADTVLAGEQRRGAGLVDQVEEVFDRVRLPFDHLEVAGNLGEAPAEARDSDEQSDRYERGRAYGPYGVPKLCRGPGAG